MNHETKKFLVSLAWNFGVFGVLAVLNYISTQLTSFGLSEIQLTIATLIVARITKVVNVYIQSHQELE